MKPRSDINSQGQLKRRRFPRAGEEAERRKLEKLGYVYRGMTKSGKHYIMTLAKAGLIDDEDEFDALETTFGLERDLQEALRKNIAQLNAGLKIVDGDKEKIVESGRIDILAEDTNGTTVIIELKAGAADREAVAQILAYMGDLMTQGKAVRGILVAGDFPARTIAAAKAVPNLELKKYAFQFS